MIKTRGMINQCISFKNKDEKNSFKKNYFLKHNIYKKFREGKKFTYSDKKANFRLVLSKILKKKYLYLKDINALDNNLENLHKYIDNKLINYESS